MIEHGRRFGEIEYLDAGSTVRAELVADRMSARGDDVIALAHPVPSDPSAWLRVTVRSLPRDAYEISWDSADSLKVSSIRLLDDSLAVESREDGYVLVPARMGLMIYAAGAPVQRSFGTYDYEGCHMAMLGVVRRGSAVLLSWDDPYITAEVRREAGVLTPTLTLRRTARSFRMRLLPDGDMLAVAEAYRGEARQKGWLVTWDEKLPGCPDREKLFGAINYKLWSALDRRMDEASEKEESVRLNWTFEEAAQVAEHLKNDLKLDRVLFTVGGWIRRGYDNQHPDILPAAPECGGDQALADCARRAMDLGYLFCLHDNYQDIYRDSPSWDGSLVMKRPDGSLAAGGHWAGGRACLVCAQEELELARRPQNLPAVRELTQANSYFIDTTYAAGLQECWDPNHPLTKTDDMLWKLALSVYARELFGVFGSECGREWAIPHADFFEGLTGVGGKCYHCERDTPDLTDRLGAVSVPLFDMVYRDCIGLHGKYGYDVTKAAGYVLHHLSMGRPLHHHNIPPHLYWQSDDPARFEELPLPERGLPDPAVFTRSHNGWAEGMHVVDRFVKNTYEILSPLHLLTARSRITGFEFLTPGRAVRRTVFGEGDDRLEVVVNGDVEDYACSSELGGEVTLPPFGFLVGSARFAAFHALSWRGLRYDAPVLFTVAALDDLPISRSHFVRFYHGFGDSRIALGDSIQDVRQEVRAPIAGPHE